MLNPQMIALADVSEAKGLSDMARTCMACGLTADQAEKIAICFRDVAAELRRAGLHGEIGHA